ncbi:MAG: hypothetical protein NTW86_12960 [Candidatus Sumerlaeota bacterium]|nr:hypothetical protein [Candidatus Sumerlaeota bacterium]
MNKELKTILEAKEARRRDLAALPIEEKIRILVRLQRMAAPIERAKGRDVRVWEIPLGE